MNSTNVKTLITAFVALSCSLGASAQRLNADYGEELKAAGFPIVQALPFSATKKDYAITALFKNKEDKTPGRIYWANISPTKEGSEMGFKESQPCVRSERPEDRIIKVSGQKIEAYYVCVAASPQETQEVYFIKSKAGNDFIKKEFAERNFVFVHLTDLPVPFNTEGFSRALAESSGKAL